MSNYKKYSMLMCAFGLMLLLFGVTYSFFNYTKTGNPNNFSVGRISFTTNQSNTINLTNVFPIDSNNINTDTDNVGTVVVTITGDTDLDKGIEYLVSSQDTNLTTQSGTAIPLSINITPNGLGDSETNYFTARESATESIYKLMIGNTLTDDEMLLVGYIAPNDPTGSSDGIDGSITIKAYFDKDKILITDTPEESAQVAGDRTIVSTSEWSSFSSTGVSFKVKVEANEGFWVTNSLEGIMSRKAVMDNIHSTYVVFSDMTPYGPNPNKGISFRSISSDTNGKGVYVLSSTANDENPIYYYRGDVKNNNVLFANKCWKIVRTTETGGTKLVYNGEPQSLMTYLPENKYNVVSSYNLAYNTRTSSWERSLEQGGFDIEFTLSDSASDYVLDLETGTPVGSSAYIYIYKNGTQIYTFDVGARYASIHFDNFGSITPSDTIRIECSGISYNAQTPNVYKLRMYHSSDTPLGIRCDNMGNDTRITVNVAGTPTDKFKFNEDNKSPAYNGYMYGTVYTYSTTGWISGRKYGSSFSYNGSTYQLVDPVSSANATHHYSCNLTDGEGRCEEIRYQINNSSGYIILTGGDGIEEAITKMQTNTNSSIVKQRIDSWYAANMTSYTNKLEDTIWCNDRSVATGNNNGWISNGGDLSTFLQYSPRARSGYGGGDYSLTGNPSLVCANKNDRFTVSNEEGNTSLTYPVGLLTQDEYALAGGITNTANVNYYLYNGDSNWLISPVDFYGNKSNQFYFFTNGSLGYNATTLEFALRPAISLKKGQNISNGSGTATDPYVIE